jgi:micrococcal nuclease
MRHRLFRVLVAAILLLAPATDASAARCSDHADQAEAQRAADTRDADGDGIYCEALPCPCLKPGTGDTRSRPSARRPAKKMRARVTSVVDGDTIKVRTSGDDPRAYTVRLIGIDTPESHKPGVPVECGAERATDHLLGLAFTRPRDTDGDGLDDRRGGTGRAVWVRTDPTQPTYDRYDRLLAYVTTRHRHRPKNLALEQLRAGWAKVDDVGKRFRTYQRFRSAQQRAEQRDRGAWRRCDGDFHSAQDD